MFHNGRTVLRGRREIDHMRRHFGHNVFALDDAQFHVRASAFPLQFVIAGLKFCGLSNDFSDGADTPVGRGLHSLLLPLQTVSNDALDFAQIA